MTSTRRLARVMRQDFTSWQRDRGRSVWKSPNILPLDAFIASLWNESLAAPPDDSVLLTRDQEALVWQQIIRDSPEGESLLQIEATARRAMEAWELIHTYRLPVDGRYQTTADCEAFLGWARVFETRAKRAGWVDAARLADRVLGRVRQGIVPRPPAAFYAGFDDLTPLQRDFLGEIDAREVQPRHSRSATRTVVCSNTDDEIRCAAGWARDILEENPAARIGIVVPSLPQLRSRIERIFRDVLATEDAFHISLGKPLSEYPLIFAALESIEVSTLDRIPLARIGLLLRSPFFDGANEERSARAALDARLRRFCRWDVSWDQVLENSNSDCRLLNRALERLSKVVAEAGAPQRHSEWSHFFSSILKTVGWPGDRPIDSREHQLLGRWTELLSRFAAFDVVSGPLRAPQAIERFRALAAGSIFQFEDPGAPVQISDQTEIAGVHFDYLWTMGLHDEAMPPPADPNPFLPLGLQWEHAFPHASAEQQRRSARRMFERLLLSAPDVVFSYPRMEGDRVLSPSPLLTASPQPWSAAPSPWIVKMRAASELETIVDEAAPPIDNGGLQRGGSHLLRDIAACPFRAFALYRLGAAQPETIEAGLTPRDKGKILHHALQLIWNELGSQAALAALSDDELLALLRRHISAVLEPFEGPHADVERVRLERLLMKWMKLERSRPPFHVAKLEEKKLIEIGGLQLEIRADRVDELPDGRQVILDYKTGAIKTRSWSGERLDEPQVPLYCISSSAPLGGAAFARIQAERVEFAGIAETPLPELQSLAGRSGPALAESVEEWRRVLARLAQQFRAGDARVDPKQGSTCDYCSVVPLCRISETHD